MIKAIAFKLTSKRVSILFCNYFMLKHIKKLHHDGCQRQAEYARIILGIIEWGIIPEQ